MKSGIGQVSQNALGTAKRRCGHLYAERSAESRESAANSQIAGGATPNAMLSMGLTERFISI